MPIDIVMKMVVRDIVIAVWEDLRDEADWALLVM